MIIDRVSSLFNWTNDLGEVKRASSKNYVKLRQNINLTGFARALFVDIQQI